MSLLSLQHIVKQYGSYKASDDVSFEIPKGKIFGLLGPNGAGKTTLIRMITRIVLTAIEGDVSPVLQVKV